MSITHLYPDFIILGAQKAGTTSIFNLLNKQKDFCGSDIKEIGFFSNDRYYYLGKEWYLNHFSHCKIGSLLFEATPEYLYYNFVAERIYYFNRKMKFIVILREPAERCYSAWNMFKTFSKLDNNNIYNSFVKHMNFDISKNILKLLLSKEFPSFRKIVLDDIDRFYANSPLIEPSFVRRGLYYQQIKNYLEYFDISSFLFIETSELSHPKFILEKLEDFLKINIDNPNIDSIKENIGIYNTYPKNVINTIKELKKFYNPHNQMLFELINKSYQWN